LDRTGLRRDLHLAADLRLLGERRVAADEEDCVILDLESLVSAGVPAKLAWLLVGEGVTSGETLDARRVDRSCCGCSDLSGESCQSSGWFPSRL